MQQVLRVSACSAIPLDASAAFFDTHLAKAKALLDQAQTTEVAIVLPSAGPEHDDWRRGLARDLARFAAPKRVNVVGASTATQQNAMLAYLRNAPGVTGQYLASHE